MCLCMCVCVFIYIFIIYTHTHTHWLLYCHRFYIGWIDLAVHIYFKSAFWQMVKKHNLRNTKNCLTKQFHRIIGVSINCMRRCSYTLDSFNLYCSIKGTTSFHFLKPRAFLACTACSRIQLYN